jgi:ribosomal protein S18 acetylase RimI-like enzyme
METHFRLARLGDERSLLAQMAEYYQYDGLTFDAQRAQAALGMLLADSRLGELWAIEQGVQMIGYFALTWGFSLESGGRDAFLDELYLREPYRGQGIGTRAVQHGIHRCRELGITAVRVEAAQRNARAQRLYRRLGFSDHERHLMTLAL